MRKRQKEGRLVTRKKDKGLTDVIGKVVSVGIGAAFMTEEYLKTVLGELSLPKDIVSGLAKNAKMAKEDFLILLKEEMGKHFSKVDPKRLLREVLEHYDLEVKASVKFKKKK